MAAAAFIAGCADFSPDDAPAEPELVPGAKGDGGFESAFALDGSALTQLAPETYTLAYALAPASRVELLAVNDPLVAWQWTGRQWRALGTLDPRLPPVTVTSEGPLYVALWPLAKGSSLLSDALGDEGYGDEDYGDEGYGEPISDDPPPETQPQACTVTARDIASFVGTPGQGYFDPLEGTNVATFPSGVYRKILDAFRPLYARSGGVKFVGGTAMPKPGLANTAKPANKFISVAWQASFDVEFKRPIPARCVGFYQRVRIRPYILGYNVRGRSVLRSWMGGKTIARPPLWQPVAWEKGIVNKWYVDTTSANVRLYSKGNPTGDPTRELSTNDMPLFYGTYNFLLYHLSFEMILVRREPTAGGGERLISLAKIPWSIAAGARGSTPRDPKSDSWSWLHMSTMTVTAERSMSDPTPPPSLLR